MKFRVRLSGEGVRLDLDHLASLGPAAIPAIDRFLTQTAPAAPGPFSPLTILHVQGLRDRLAFEHRSGSSNWRDWTFRKWRLTRYLDSREAPVPISPTGPALAPADGPNR